MDVSLKLEEKPDRSDLELIWDMLRSYNRSQVGASDHQQLTIIARDHEGTVVGGLYAATEGGWLHIEDLVMVEGLRRHGVGTKLLKLAEEESVRRGCRYAHLDTHSFQALSFYEKRGYSLFGVLDNCPAGHQKYFLKKELA